MAIIKRYIKKNGQRKLCYQAQIYIRGVRLQSKTFKNKTTACVWHDKQKENLLKNPSDYNQEKQTVFFSECFERYLKEAFPLLGKSTQQGYETRSRYLTKGPLPNLRMEDLNAKCIYNWMNWLKKHPTAKNKGRKNFIGELKFLSAVLNWYRNFVDEDFNVPITKKHRQLCHYKPVPPKRPDYFARPEELRAWIKWLKENRNNPVYWRLASFMLLTGARVGEACGMLWSAVDLEQKTARVIRRIRWDQQTKRPYLEDTTKSSASVRPLILSDELMAILKEMKKESNGKELLFTDSKGEALRYNAIQASFNTGFQALNLPWRSTHILRHSYATMALIATRDLSSVQASLGHTDMKVTQQYAKVIALLSRDTAEKTTKAFNLFNKEISTD
ncbi:MAG: site-specific integrase [Bdellovibrionales bacterium]|nr:site-specific integrase [Bdellovibrionales bacterium]